MTKTYIFNQPALQFQIVHSGNKQLKIASTDKKIKWKFEDNTYRYDISDAAAGISFIVLDRDRPIFANSFQSSGTVQLKRTRKLEALKISIAFLIRKYPSVEERLPN